jgi:hypothetical protein
MYYFSPFLRRTVQYVYIDLYARMILYGYVENTVKNILFSRSELVWFRFMLSSSCTEQSRSRKIAVLFVVLGAAAVTAVALYFITGKNH